MPLSSAYGYRRATSYYRAPSRVTTIKWSQPQAPPAEGNPRHGDKDTKSTRHETPLEDFSETFGAVCSEDVGQSLTGKAYLEIDHAATMVDATGC
nr:uncharacterized protein CTRU02_01802 [Colletotrichum truncatum]KAF6798931.1 hypothetical protein CTRU02_01802 [Colletotrichum truncatum]